MMVSSGILSYILGRDLLFEVICDRVGGLLLSPFLLLLTVSFSFLSKESSSAHVSVIGRFRLSGGSKTYMKHWASLFRIAQNSHPLSALQMMLGDELQMKVVHFYEKRVF